MTSKVDVEGAFLFEQSFARVPYENYRKVFRSSQKNIEREFGAIQSAVDDVSSTLKTGTAKKEDIASAIDGMIGRAETLKRKLSDLHESAGKPTQDVIRERLQHMATIENLDSTADSEYSKWADKRLDRWLVDWCLRHGKEKTAKQIAREKDIEVLVDLDLFSDIRRIESALSEHSCTEALAWCSENKASLRKVKNTLEFDLRLQEYIELCRSNKQHEAILYQRKHLISWQETHLVQIQQACGLLAFSAGTTCRPYMRLYDPSRWTSLIKLFRRSIYMLNTLPSEPLLNLALYAGLASLKLPACYDHSTKNVDCPVCDGETGSGSGIQGMGLGKLAEEVPSSYHANSTIVCYITKKIMDADNMPMAFPSNGYVYSREAMEEMATRNNGVVTCPRTGISCPFTELRKVFIS
ncbi:MAG: CTLH/CRA C-terminal to lish motif domain-containing protein [Lentinula lateritia]|uniref:CTLH/CRA C-terminal to lish motif domain-containing protein n=1 Tax=Lentinula lateritia TaxID=40482 RepID=A0ABQ8V5H3_9AGAR|nr:MAG: CTLH/CRA C-terminal to lish motif domain-containing protein [Lentinula lateritia]KAJ4474186.1 CTLH/CRA C-terminal to lish motif domain-containing protein [Lentinula lateritia]